MKVDGVSYRTIWPAADGAAVEVIDQTRLPFAFVIRRLTTVAEIAAAIRTMVVRGAPLIGAAAGYGMALACQADAADTNIDRAHTTLLATRPTAVNLKWALDRMRKGIRAAPPESRRREAYRTAALICDEDVAANRAIGEHGHALIDALWTKKRRQGRLNVLTHCNAGWLATVDWGTALAPVYRAHDAGVPVHVYVDETRPRNQGARLTAWELLKHGVPHTLIADNAGGHLLQHGAVDLVLVGTDRTTGSGDVANKIGTYLKALAASDNGVPFYVAAPSSSIDFGLDDGVRQIPIEERDARELTEIEGEVATGQTAVVRLAPHGSPALNVGFDVTPARLVTALITERGVCDASRAGLARLFPEATGSGA
ncbi:MAG: S-methyl-5-thioribose-1-phosphate isomerase [Deltaproteobacteria bacterium]|nr:S-methyl-5-thioribose-1-phosphate isomerase [Deltaproteobacteria bacterium]